MVKIIIGLVLLMTVSGCHIISQMGTEPSKEERFEIVYIEQTKKGGYVTVIVLKDRQTDKEHIFIGY